MTGEDALDQVDAARVDRIFAQIRRAHAWVALLFAYVAGVGSMAVLTLTLNEGSPRLLLVVLTLGMAGAAVFSTARGRRA